jgi:predicted helicase
MNNNFFKSINSWHDFDQKLSSLGNKEKGDAFELLTKCYFKIKPQYNHYDEVWLLDEVPQKELDYLKIPSHDLGIDLIAKEGKEYYAIQCKYHGDQNQNITYKEVSTFLQQVESNKKITMGYICSSANGTSKNYQKIQKKQIQEILADSWQLLDKAFFDKVRNLLNNKAVKEKPFIPRKHQEKAVKQALNHFVKENNSRGKLIFPCGSGKSLTGYWLSEALESKSTLIAVPSLSLVKQTLEVYLREIVANGIKVKWLCICSDEGIGTSDDVAIMTNNIGVPCKTDPEYIRAWLKENKDEHKIIFTTYQSGHLIADISKKLKLSFDLGIFDEAHKTVGSNLKKFSYLLFEKNIKIDKRIFMTATERFYSGSKEDIVSMDDEDVYGDTFAHMSFKEAIDLDLLTDYKVITIDIKKSEIAEFIRDNNLVKLNTKWKRETDARSLASMLAMRKAMKQFNIKNVVSFHSSIEKAKRNKELQQYITDTYNYKPIDTYTVSGKIPTTKRNVIVQEFAKSDRALITNARCLTEGIDVPNIDCIVFADPRKSKVDIVQALGRALRKKDGKEWGYVILPVVYNGDTNEIDNDSFNEILNREMWWAKEKK